MQILYSSSSSVRPISDIFVSISCSSTFLKQLYCPFSSIILDFVSGEKETIESQLYLNYFVSVVILEVYIEKIRQFQIDITTITFWIFVFFIHLFLRLSLRDDISWEINSPSHRWKNHGNWWIIFIPWSLSFYFMQRQVLGRATRPRLSRCPFQVIP